MVQAVVDPIMKETEPYLQEFERFEQAAKQPAWVSPLRKAGMAHFAKVGFPTLQQEDWRFTNVAPIASRPFKPVFEPTRNGLTADSLSRFPFADLAAIRLVFLNGHFSPDLSTLGAVPEGVTVVNLAAALADNVPVLEQHLGRHAQNQASPFTALNTAFFQDGACIHVLPGRVVERPIHLLYLSTSNESGATAQPRTLVVAESGSEVTVIETYVGVVNGPYFTNAVTELVLGENAVVEHVKLQAESSSAYHIATIHAQLGRNSNLVAHSIATGAKLSRNNIRTALAGEGVECVLNGLYLTRDEQLADHHMVVEHAQPHCNSHEYYNGILEGRSKGVFHGRILVRQAAQKTDAKQTNKNLLLSDEATVDTKPQLEIYADDVKCTHGATVGQLNEESIFYLRARGIGVETARRMLIHAFAGEIIERIRHMPVREELNQVIWDRLEANPKVGEKK